MTASYAASAQQASTPPKAAAAASAPDAAKSDVATQLDTVVITARKRTESIDVVPLAVTAMGSAKIEERNLKSLEDVAAFTPGFYMQQQTGTGTGRNDRSFSQLTFRGIGANSTNVGVGAGGVAFLDGSPVLNSSLSNVQDLDRVEVLRGPQGVYFGRSTFIGAVNYITKDPTEKWTGRATTEVGQAGLVDTSLAVSGAILPDTLSVRLSGRHYTKDGQYYTSNANGREGDQGTDSISAVLLYRPITGLKDRYFYNHFEDHDGPPAQYVIGGRGAQANCNLGGTGGSYYCGQVPQKPDPSLISANLTMTPAIYAGLLQNNTNVPVPFDFASFLNNYGLKRKADQTSNKLEYLTESGITLTSVTAYHQEKVVTLSDFAFVAEPTVFATSVGYKDHDWSQELRATSSPDDRLRWTAGVNYVDLYNTSSGIIGDYGPVGGPYNFGYANIAYLTAKTPAAFGGVYYDVLPGLTLTGEARYQSDKISDQYPTSATNYANISKTFDSFSPRISVDYKLTPTEIVYALASRGYKPGGFNQAILTQPQFVLNQLASTGAAAVYDQEKLNNYEAGIKGSFLDGKLRMALDGYIGRYLNAQVPIPITYYSTQNADGSPNTTGPLNSALLVRNAGKVDLKGLEFESEAIVARGLRIGGTFAYTGTNIRNYYCNECAGILAQNATNNIQNTAPIGKRLPGAPEITYTLSSNYEREVAEGVVGYIGGDYIFRGSYYAEAANIASSGSSKTFNLRIGARKDNYDVEFFARNLFDNQSPSISYYPVDANSPFAASSNAVRVGLPDKRRLGIRANVTF